MRRIILLVTLLFMLILSGCAKPQIIRIFPPEEIAKMDIEKVIEDKKLSSEEKAQIIQMKMSEDIERKKRAVEMEKDNKLSSIINRPVAPLRTPDTILRVLILPYEDDQGVLNGWKYSYVKVDDGKWVMADYLNGTKPSTNMTLTPLHIENDGSIKAGEMAPPINDNDIKYTVKKDEKKASKKQNIKNKKNDNMKAISKPEPIADKKEESLVIVEDNKETKNINDKVIVENKNLESYKEENKQVDKDDNIVEQPSTSTTYDNIIEEKNNIDTIVDNLDKDNKASDKPDNHSEITDILNSDDIIEEDNKLIDENKITEQLYDIEPLLESDTDTSEPDKTSNTAPPINNSPALEDSEQSVIDMKKDISVDYNNYYKYGVDYKPKIIDGIVINLQLEKLSIPV